MSSTQDWKYDEILPYFQNDGCTVEKCPFNRNTHPDWNFCALNLSDALIRAGYTLPDAEDVNYCQPPHAHGEPLRVRNADGLARICKEQNGGRIDASGWANRPAWKGIVYFEGNFSPDVSGHIDLWDGKQGVHGTYPDAKLVWFWKLG